MVPGSDLSAVPGKPGRKLNDEEVSSCVRMLKESEMFHKVPLELMSELTSRMTVERFKKNEKFVYQGQPCHELYLLEHGEIQRRRFDAESGKEHNVEFVITASSINSMRILSGDLAHNTIKCVSDNGCKMYKMKRDDLLAVLKAKPEITVQIAEGLSDALRTGSKKYQTPFLQQQQQEVNVPAVAIAAGIESYYRSALNAMLNARLTGVRGELFPNMHIQVPVRITYITGFKVLRASLDKNVDPDQYDYPNIVRLAMAVLPGVGMTPIASVLEASNAGHMNPESMATRWMRGAVPRCGREIVFGLGLNQMSDYFDERVKPFMPHSPMISNALGSLIAGVLSGYLSHVPHNLSTYKLLEPRKSYMELYPMFVNKSVPPQIEQMVAKWPSFARTATRTFTATLFPRGLLIRTTQIVGSFMILNGAINYLHLVEQRKIHKVISSAT